MASLFRLLVLPLTLLLTLTASGCGSSGGSSAPPPPVGTLNLTIVDGSSDPLTGIAEANILLLDGAGDPVKNFTSIIDGTVASQSLLTGSYQLKVSANDFNPSPAPKVPPLPVQITANQTTDITIKLYPHADAGTLGTITGSVTDGSGNGITGALVIAKTGGISVATTISAADGSYILHNVPANSTPELTAFIKDFNFIPVPSEAVTADGTTADQNIVADSDATGVISGNLSFVAGASVVLADVTLLDPETREVIPGLRVNINDANSYTMSGIPDGDFEIIASLLNDGIVLDPDLSSTQGVPLVTINADTHTRDFKVTGAVELDTPQTPTNNNVPELSNIPTFEWHRTSSYSSTEVYAIELVDESGVTIWGGFDLTGQPIVTVPNNGTNSSILYNNVSLPALEASRYYQLRIFAIKYVTVSDTYPDGIQTLSSTENLDGVFKVKELP